jgi:hypothetical protein
VRGIRLTISNQNLAFGRAHLRFLFLNIIKGSESLNIIFLSCASKKEEEK